MYRMILYRSKKYENASKNNGIKISANTIKSTAPAKSATSPFIQKKIPSQAMFNSEIAIKVYLKYLSHFIM